MGVLSVIPDVLTIDIGEVQEKTRLVQGLAQRFHVDILDGQFADNLTVSPADLHSVDFGDLQVDLHLMVDDPVAWIEGCVALSPARLIAHIERMGSQRAYVDRLTAYGHVGVGLGVDLFTPIASLEKSVLPDVKLVLLMAVPAGYSGQLFDERVLPKIGELREIYAGRILVDGGITVETARRVAEAGAHEVAVNSYLWSFNAAQDILKERLEALAHA